MRKGIPGDWGYDDASKSGEDGREVGEASHKELGAKGGCEDCAGEPGKTYGRSSADEDSFRPTQATQASLPRVRAEDLCLFDRPNRGALALVFFNIMFPAAAVDLLVEKVCEAGTDLRVVWTCLR